MENLKFNVDVGNVLGVHSRFLNELVYFWTNIKWNVYDVIYYILIHITSKLMSPINLH